MANLQRTEEGKINKFTEIGRYKNDILLKLLNNERIVKALMFDVPNFLDVTDDYDVTELIYNRIYDLPYIPDFQKYEGVYITIELDGYQRIDTVYKKGFLKLNVFGNTNLWKTDYNMNRIDFLISEIYQTLEGIRELGFGKLKWIATPKYSPERHIMGLSMVFEIIDLNS